MKPLTSKPTIPEVHATSRPELPLLSVLLFLLMVLGGCQGGEQAIAPSTEAPSTEAPDTPESSVSVQEDPIDVVFGCQYGYAKSLVSSRHFERMAEDRGIPVRVIARGITPKDSVPEPLATALSGDGFEVGSFQPQALDIAELVGAEYVVSFGNEMPESPDASTLDWSDVSALSEDYTKARTEIVGHLNDLLDTIEANKARAE